MDQERRARLESLSQKLADRGVVDVRFFVDRSGNPSQEKVVDDTCEVIEAYLSGNFTPAAPIGDSVRFRETFDYQIQ